MLSDSEDCGTALTVAGAARYTYPEWIEDITLPTFTGTLFFHDAPCIELTFCAIAVEYNGTGTPIAVAFIGQAAGRNSYFYALMSIKEPGKVLQTQLVIEMTEKPHLSSAQILSELMNLALTKARVSAAKK